MSQRQGAWFLGIVLGSFSFLEPESAWLLCVGVLLWDLFIERGPDEWTFTGVRHVALFIAIALVGALQFSGHAARDVVRDIWIMSLPIVPFLVGWLFARKLSKDTATRTILVTSIVLSVFFLVQVIVVTIEGAASDSDSYRQEVGAVNVLIVLACLLALDFLWQKRNAIQGRRALAILTIATGLLAIVYSFSRTWYVVLAVGVVLVLVPSRLTTQRRRAYWVLLFGGIVGVVSFAGLLDETDRNNSPFLKRLANSIREISATETESEARTGTLYRAYESAMALQTYQQGTSIQLVLGQGAGALVDLRMVLELGALKESSKPEFQYVPILHNGYMYLLVKTGVVGLVLFLAQILMLWRSLNGSKAGALDGRVVRMGRGILISTLAATVVISGPYNEGGWFSAMLLLGLSIGVLLRASPRRVAANLAVR